MWQSALPAVVTTAAAPAGVTPKNVCWAAAARQAYLIRETLVQPLFDDRVVLAARAVPLADRISGALSAAVLAELCPALVGVPLAGKPPKAAAGDGPVPALMADELTLARSGALDTNLLSQQGFYGTNFTKPLLFIEDGSYFATQAQAMGLTGSQWGVMNETGSYPGQPWLWLYTLWYQVPGWTNSANIDMIAVYMTGAATILLLCVPFIPGLRDIPRLIPVHKLIWRNWDGSPPEPGTHTGQASPQSPDHVTS